MEGTETAEPRDGSPPSAAAPSAATRIVIVRKAELAAGTPGDYDDPDQIAFLGADKRQVILSNPLLTSDDDPVQILGLVGRQVVGKIDLIRGELTVERKPVPMLWASAVFVHEAFRKTMLGLSLIFKFQSLSPTIGACGVSRMVLPIFQKLGWFDFTMQRFLALRRSRSVVDRLVGSGVRGMVASWGADLALLGHRTALRAFGALRCRGLRLEPFDVADDRFDDLIATSAASPPFQSERSAAWLTWVLKNRFDDDTRNRRQGFYVVGAGGRRVAYFAVKSRFYPIATHRGFRNLLLGSLLDWEIFDRDAVGLTGIAMLARGVLAGWNVDAVEICVPSSGPDAVTARTLRRLGFARMGELHLLIKGSPRSPLMAEDKAIDLRDQANWRIRPIAGDNSFA